jgi:hypothetical protein
LPTPTAQVANTEKAHPLGGSSQGQGTVVPGPDVGGARRLAPPRIAGGVGDRALRAVQDNTSGTGVAPAVGIQPGAPSPRRSHTGHPGAAALVRAPTVATAPPCARIGAAGASARPTSVLAPHDPATAAARSGVCRDAPAVTGRGGQREAEQPQQRQPAEPRPHPACARVVHQGPTRTTKQGAGSMRRQK